MPEAQRLNWLSNSRSADRPAAARPDGDHEPADWDTALTEIAARLRGLRDADAAAGPPSSFAYVGGGGEGNHSGGSYGSALRKWMGSTRYFNALSQQKTGEFWVNGKLFGAQTCHTAEGIEECDLLVVIGCNPWLAHGFTNARRAINTIKNDPNRKMIVLDPQEPGRGAHTGSGERAATS